MIKSLPQKLILEELRNDNPLIIDQGKLSKTMGVSVENLKRIGKLKIENSTHALREIADIDRNYADDLLDFFEIWNRIDKKFKVDNNYRMDKLSVASFLSSTLDLLKWGYNLKHLLNYITKQSLIYNRLRFPAGIMTTLRDYVSMGRDMNAPYERYPQYLQKAHFIFARNYSVAEDKELRKRFEKVVKGYSNLEIMGSEYSLIVPKNIDDLIKEGNTLHHCITSYGRKIANGESIILFLRKTDNLDEPFVTVEINDKNRITQIKQVYDQDVNSAIQKEAEDLLKKIA